ncbi:mammalian cell entry protein [Mycobacterium sp. E1747]|nr:mammalian cell entry protein [Mycobacterium sp. E1747]
MAEQRNSRLRLVITAGLVICVALAALVGWLGFRAYQSHQAQEQRALFLQVGRQGALNLTTIDWQRADTDVQRILDSATGKFYDDMSKRQEPFVGVVKKAQSKSVGTITEAGLESESGDDAQVLVAVSVQTSNLGATDQRPRAWRMRISVHKTGDEVKVSNVEFVP